LLARPSLDLIKLKRTDLDPLGPQPRYDWLQFLGHLVVVEMLHTHLYERAGPILIGLGKFFFAPAAEHTSIMGIASFKGSRESTDKQVILPLRRTDR
jgi:hypothetical protein